MSSQNIDLIEEGSQAGGPPQGSSELPNDSSFPIIKSTKPKSVVMKVRGKSGFPDEAVRDFRPVSGRDAQIIGGILISAFGLAFGLRYMYNTDGINTISTGADPIETPELIADKITQAGE
jgi:hypothetical protein